MLALCILEVTSLTEGNKIISLFYLVKTEANVISCLATQTPLMLPARFAS